MGTSAIQICFVCPAECKDAGSCIPPGRDHANDEKEVMIQMYIVLMPAVCIFPFCFLQAHVYASFWRRWPPGSDSCEVFAYCCTTKGFHDDCARCFAQTESFCTHRADTKLFQLLNFFVWCEPPKMWPNPHSCIEILYTYFQPQQPTISNSKWHHHFFRMHAMCTLTISSLQSSTATNIFHDVAFTGQEQNESNTCPCGLACFLFVSFYMLFAQADRFSRDLFAYI